MGYILPIVQHQYRHYHERTIQSNERKTQIEKTFKVLLNEITEEQSSDRKYRNHEGSQSDQTLEMTHFHSLYSETQKGMFLDEKI